MRRLRFLVLLALVAALLATVAAAEAQSKTLVWEQYDVFLNVLPNGDLRVTERQTIDFTAGTFTFGYRTIPLDKTEGITDFAISEPGGPTYQQTDYSIDPATFWVDQKGDEVEVRWYFPPTQNSQRTFDISYTAKGAVRIYETGDKLQWIAIDSVRDFPVNNSVVQVSLPEGTSFLDIDSAGVEAEWAQGESGRTVRYVAQRRLTPSDTFEIGVEFTHGVIPADEPSWQAAHDEDEFYDLNVRPMLTLGVGVLAALIGLGGPILVYGIWYTRGRDPNIGPVPDTLSLPPDDLPPGVLGSLIDEQADMQDVIASIVDMARRGYLVIEEIEKKGLFGLGSQDFTFRRTDKSEGDLRAYEKRILKGIFGSHRQERKLSSLRNSFYRHLPKIQEDLYKELVREGLFKRRPDSTRKVWTGIGVAAIVLAFLGGIILVPLAQYAGTFPCLAVALGLGGVSLLIAGRFMPVKSVKGAESAAKWGAFRNFLSRIDQLTDIGKASEQFERFLPYAIAFGMNQSFVTKFARLANTPAPGWYVPYPHLGVPGRSSGAGGLAKEMPAGAGAGSGGLQSMSDSMAGGLQSMSDGLTNMLNSAGRIMRSAPSSSGSSGGGGFSGGGFSGGGGGGGGGAGFG